MPKKIYKETNNSKKTTLQEDKKTTLQEEENLAIEYLSKLSIEPKLHKPITIIKLDFKPLQTSGSIVKKVQFLDHSK